MLLQQLYEVESDIDVTTDVKDQVEERKARATLMMVWSLRQRYPAQSREIGHLRLPSDEDTVKSIL